LSDDGLSPEAAEFVVRFIESIHQVELLMLLRRTPDRWWTADDIARELRESSLIVSADLLGLRTYGLVAVQSAVPMTYRYEPGSVHLHAGVESLAAAYQETPLALAKAVAKRPDRVLRTFADAFRLRRGDR
jgi:hypothetical protein